MSSSSNTNIRDRYGFKRIERSLSCSNLSKLESAQFKFKPKCNIELPFQQFHELYSCTELLFEGLLSKVFLNFDKTTAIKMLDFSAISDGVKLELHKVRQLAEREVNALKTLDHPNIIKLLHYTIDTTLQATYMAFEYYPHQDLLDYLERSEYKGSVLLECFAKGIFHQLVSAVQHCHENNICHGDIKPDNILIANRDSIFSCKKVTVPHIVLIDFGLSQVFSRSDDGKESFLNEVIGSPGYVAPEIIERNPYHGTKIDVWSLGVFLYCTLFCEYPYKLDQTARDPWTKIVSLMKAHKFHFPSSIPVSQRAKDLIRRMLCYNPTERITVCEILTDRWFDCLR